MLIRIVYALPAEQWIEDIELSEGTSVGEALAMSAFSDKYPDIDISQTKVGVFAKLVKPEQILRNGDRIEIYRSLPPKARNAHAADDKKARIRAKKERRQS